jgi:hypothetical protein
LYNTSLIRAFPTTLRKEVESVLACLPSEAEGSPAPDHMQQLADRKFAVEKAIEIIRLKSEAEQKIFWQIIMSGFGR